MKVIEQIENILRVSSKARNSDKELMIIYMQKFGLELSDRQVQKFKEMPSFETLRRSRQILQMQGKYPADPEVEQARYDKMKEVRANIVHAQPAQLLDHRGEYSPAKEALRARFNKETV